MRALYHAGISILAASILAGCAPYGALTKDYGKSYNAVKAGQILNPGASANLAPVTGLPGAAADGAMKKYAESFAPSEQAQQAPKATIMPVLPMGDTGMERYGSGKK